MTDLKAMANITCLYCGWLNATNISCEFLGKDHGIVIRFDNYGHKNRVLSQWCFSLEGHKECPIAMANYRYYTRKEKEKEGCLR